MQVPRFKPKQPTYRGTLEEGTVALSVTSPPYANMLNHPRLNKSIRGDRRQNAHFLKVQQYSKDPREEAWAPSTTRLTRTLSQKMYRGILPLLRPQSSLHRQCERCVGEQPTLSDARSRHECACSCGTRVPKHVHLGQPATHQPGRHIRMAKQLHLVGNNYGVRPRLLATGLTPEERLDGLVA